MNHGFCAGVLAIALSAALAVGGPAGPAGPPGMGGGPALFSPPAAGHRRALLIGIDDYLTLQPAAGAAGSAHAADRGLRNLGGAVRDVQDMRDMLLTPRFGFAPGDVLVLVDRQATRRAILAAIGERLIKPAHPGDIELFYFAGHGSQVANSLSDERDKLDESVVPADTARGAPDIRDKELRRLFNRVLDRGARLTVVLDSCHSGSGARGLPDGGQPRGIQPDLHDVADGSPWGPRPEDRGALVLAAAQDFDLAWEMRDERRQLHGAFSLALLWAIRDGAADEPAEDTFRRARARLQEERRFQEPVLAGTAGVRQSPFLGTRPAAGPRGPKAPTAVVERLDRDGTVRLAGGWADGLTPGSELRPAGAAPPSEVRLVVSRMLGLGRCEARLVASPADRKTPPALAAGTPLEVVRWAAPPAAPLRLWMPQATATAAGAAVALAAELAQSGRRAGLRWVNDPTDETPGYLLRWRPSAGWELLLPGGGVRRFPAGAPATAILAAMPRAGAALFVELPASRELVAAMAIGAGTLYDGVEAVERPQDADYILAGRWTGRRVEYAWIRPGIGPRDRDRSGLPARTDWLADDPGPLAGAVLGLRKIHAWLHFESPAGSVSPYRLGFRREGAPDLVHDRVLIGQERYGIVLRTPTPLPPTPPTPVAPSSSSAPPGAPAPPAPSAPPGARQRWFYLFAIDSRGRSILLYPDGGSVENRFAVAGAGEAAPAELALGEATSFRITEPYGIDTYFLLTSEEPIANPGVLEWDGVRTRGPAGTTALEELLAVTGGAERSAASIAVPANWSVEKEQYESVSPHPLP